LIESVSQWWSSFTGSGGWPYLVSTGGAFVITVLALQTELRLLKRSKGSPTPLDAKEAKRRAKRENERIKLSATFLNSVGIAIMFATVVTPLFKALGGSTEPVAWGQALIGVSLSFGFHLLGLWSLTRWRSEE
jgi:hypothetical protein